MDDLSVKAEDARQGAKYVEEELGRMKAEKNPCRFFMRRR